MRKIKRIIPLLLAATMITACGSKALQVQDGEKTLINSQKEEVNKISYQELYEKIYDQYGASVAADELIYRLGVQVFKDSGRSQSEWDERVKEKMDAYFNSSYILDNVFNENVFVANLQSKGYSITCPANVFRGTKEDLTNDSLYQSLKCDYTNFIEMQINQQIAKEIINEEYILNEKQVYFGNKVIRRVQYFKFKPANYADIDTYSTKFTNYINQVNTKDLSIIAKQDGGLIDQWKTYLYDEELKTYGTIDFTKSTKYSNLYTNIFDTSNLTSSITDEIKANVKEYTDDGARSLAEGHEQMMKAIANQVIYGEAFGTNEGSTLINADIDALIFKTDNKISLNGNGYLQATSGSDSIVIKSADSYYYIVKVDCINANSSAELKKIGARALSTNAANVKNAIQYYLNKYGVTIHEENFWNLINETYNYKG